MPFNNPLAGGLKLIREALQSPNYDPAAQTGWTINKDGTADFTAGVFVNGNPVPAIIDYGTAQLVGVSAPYASTTTEVVMTVTRSLDVDFKAEHLYRVVYNVQYDANDSGGVGCAVRFRIRQGDDTTGTFRGGAETPVLTKVYSSFRPTQKVEALWLQEADVNSAVILTVQREQQSTGTVIGEVNATDYFYYVEDLGPPAIGIAGI